MVRVGPHHPPRFVPLKVWSRTVTPFWTTVILALVNVMWVITAVQLSFGHPPSVPVAGCGGGFVVTLKKTVPFLMSLAGIAWVPVTAICWGFCPGAWLPPWFVQVVDGIAVAE